MLCERLHGNVAAMRQSAKSQRCGPSVVDNANRAVVARNGGERWYIADFHGEAARAFQHDSLGPLAKLSCKFSCIEGIEKAVLNAHLLEQSHRHRARWIVSIVAHQHDIAGPQHRQKRACKSRHSAGVEHCAKCLRFQRSNGICQRPLRWRASPPVEKTAVRVCLNARS